MGGWSPDPVHRLTTIEVHEKTPNRALSFLAAGLRFTCPGIMPGSQEPSGYEFEPENWVVGPPGWTSQVDLPVFDTMKPYHPSFSMVLDLMGLKNIHAAQPLALNLLA